MLEEITHALDLFRIYEPTLQRGVMLEAVFLHSLIDFITFSIFIIRFLRLNPTGITILLLPLK
jgi:hypothetical protein